jgi:hypothetical protein
MTMIGLMVVLAASVCAMAESLDPETPMTEPEWLTGLFPYTGEPGRRENRLRRISSSELEVNGRKAGSVIVEYRYPGIDGRDEVSRARIFLPPELRADSTRRVPLIHNAGYELDENSAIGLLAKGYAVSTPHAQPLNPLGRSVILDRAIIHAMRQIPFIDPLRVSIQGGSAGGWMTLMLAADAFPLVWAMPDVPPIHWGYNAAFIGEHNSMAAAPPGSDQPRMPYLFMVGVIAEQTKALYGMPFDSPTLLAVSPLAHLDTITAPTLATFSTADILVPIDQVGADLARPFDAKLLPEGFRTAMTDRFLGVKGKRTLLTALPKDRYELFVLPLPDDLPRVKIGGTPPAGVKPIPLPFSKQKVWSIVVIDEGPIEPGNAHTRYIWGMDHEPFRKWAEQRGVTADQLSAPKLQRLMMRLMGEPWRPFRARPGGKVEEIAGNLLDYPEAERADVLTGLRAFAEEDARARQLAKLYDRLPKRLKALGDKLGAGSPDGVRAALKSR